MRRSILAFATLALLAAPAASHAQTITFDDLAGDFSSISNGYAGLDWSNFSNLNATTYSGNPSGYQAGMVSPNNVAYNGFGSPASISSGSTFTLNSGYFTAAWNDDLQLSVVGRLGATTLFSNTYTLSATTPTLLTFDYAGVDNVEFSTSGGTQHAGYNGGGTHFALDNLTINAPTTAPEPGTVGLVATGLFAVAGAAARRRKGAAA